VFIIVIRRENSLLINEEAAQTLFPISKAKMVLITLNLMSLLQNFTNICCTKK